MRSKLLMAALLGLATAVGAATPAAAAVTITYTGGSFKATGDAAADTIIAKDGPNQNSVAVQVPGTTVTDPDGAGGVCTASGDTATCNTNYVTLSGGAGADTLTDTRVNPDDFFQTTLDGGDGPDTLTGGQLADTLLPGPGADRVRGGTPIDGPGGPPLGRFTGDFVSYAAAPGPVTVTLDDQPGDGPAGEGDDIGSDVEGVTGSAFGDTLVAGPGDAQLRGLQGDDTLVGGPGDDQLQGGGDEQFNGGGSGSDRLFGGGGDDRLAGNDNPLYSLPAPARTPAGTDVLDGGPGRDTLTDDDGPDEIRGGSGVDTVFASRDEPRPNPVPPRYVAVPLGFTISLDGVANDGVTGSSEGDDVKPDVENVLAGDGPDTLVGSAGPELFEAYGGNDSIDPGPGPDSVLAGEGDDTIRVQDGITDRVDGGLGTDSAVADLPGGQPEKADLLQDVESITGTPLPTVVDVTQLKGAPPPPPNTAPKVTVTGLTATSKAFLKAGTLTLKVTSDEPATFVGELLAAGRLRAVGDLVVGTGKLALGTGTRSLKLTVPKATLGSYKRRLRTKAQRKKGITLRARVVATDALGLPTTTTKTVRIRG